MHKTYSIAEFRKNTRTILNEALLEPVRIKRFNDEFIISNASPQINTVTVYKMEAIPPRDKDFALKEDTAIGSGDIPDPYLTAHTALMEAPVPTKDRVIMDETGQLHGTDMQFCKHNAVKGFCKKGCK